MRGLTLHIIVVWHVVSQQTNKNKAKLIYVQKTVHAVKHKLG